MWFDASGEGEGPTSKARLEEKRSRARRRASARQRSREILAHYLECAPESVLVERGGRGKPSIGGGNAHDISYSLTHSGDYALLAVSKGCSGALAAPERHAAPTMSREYTMKTRILTIFLVSRVAGPFR